MSSSPIAAAPPDASRQGPYIPGQPVTFATGVFARRTIRAEVEEIQKADLGRKYARKDKRPLDPPPVVVCRLFQLVDRPSGPPLEVEIDPEQILGAICHVDLFPVPDDIDPSVNPVTSASAHHIRQHQDQYTAVLPPIHSGPSSSHVHPLTSAVPAAPSGPTHLQPMMPPMAHLRENAQPLPPLETLPSLYASLGSTGYPPHASAPPLAPSHIGAPSASGMASSQPVLPGVHNMMSDYAYSSAARYAAEGALGAQGDELVAWIGSFPIHEKSKYTTMLSGATFMQSAVIDYKGKKTAMFVFSDLAVKIEGTFVLRYRAFTLFSECAQEPHMPVLAECFGGMFKIYSTKEFPGLLASTELTKRLALHGVRVNLRETPRRRRKKHEMDEDANMSDRDHDRQAGAGHDDFVYSGSETATTTSPTVPFGPGPSSRSPITASFPSSSSSMSVSAMAAGAYSPTDSVTSAAGGASSSFASAPPTIYSGLRSGSSSRAGMGAMSANSGSRGGPVSTQAMGPGARGMGRARGASSPGRYYARSESSMDE